MEVLDVVEKIFKAVDQWEQFNGKDAKMDELRAVVTTVQSLLRSSRLDDEMQTRIRSLLEGFTLYLDKYKAGNWASQLLRWRELQDKMATLETEMNRYVMLATLATTAYLSQREERHKEDGRAELDAHGGWAKSNAFDLAVFDVPPTRVSADVRAAQSGLNIRKLAAYLQDAAAARLVVEAAAALYELCQSVADDKPVLSDLDVNALLPGLLAVLRDARYAAASFRLARVYAALSIRGMAMHRQHERRIAPHAVGALASVLLEGRGVNDEETCAACAALVNLAAQDAHKRYFLGSGLIKKLVDLVNPLQIDGAQRSAVRGYAVHALRELSTEHDVTDSAFVEHRLGCYDEIVAAGGINQLLAALPHVPSDVGSSALTVLWNVAEVQANREAIARGSHVEDIVKWVERVVESKGGANVDAGVSLLAVLAQDDVNDKRIHDANGVDVLIDIFVSADTPSDCVVWALSELADDKSNAIKMLPCVRRLSQALVSDSPIQRRKAGVALAFTAQLVDDKRELVDRIDLEFLVNQFGRISFMWTQSVDSAARHEGDVQHLETQLQNFSVIIAALAGSDGSLRSELQSPALIKALLHMTRVQTLVTPASLALSALVRTMDDLACDTIVQNNGVKLLVRVVQLEVRSCSAAERRHRNTERGTFESANMYALEALGSLVRSGHATDAHFELDDTSVILRALKDGSRLEKCAAITLLNLLAQRCVQAVDHFHLQDYMAECWSILPSATDDIRGAQPMDISLWIHAVRGLACVRERLKKLRSSKLKGKWTDECVMRLLGLVRRHELRDAVSEVLDAIANEVTTHSTVLELLQSLLDSGDRARQSQGLFGLAVFTKEWRFRHRFFTGDTTLASFLDLVAAGNVDEDGQRYAIWIAENFIEDIGFSALCEPRGVSVFENLLTGRMTTIALRVFNCLSRAPAFVPVAIKLDAHEGLCNSWDDSDDLDERTIVLDTLVSMSSHRDSAALRTSRHLISSCIEALESRTDAWKERGLTILINLYSIEGDHDAKKDFAMNVKYVSGPEPLLQCFDRLPSSVDAAGYVLLLVDIVGDRPTRSFASKSSLLIDFMSSSSTGHLPAARALVGIAKSDYHEYATKNSQAIKAFGNMLEKCTSGSSMDEAVQVTADFLMATFRSNVGAARGMIETLVGHALDQQDRTRAEVVFLVVADLIERPESQALFQDSDIFPICRTRLRELLRQLPKPDQRIEYAVRHACVIVAQVLTTKRHVDLLIDSGIYSRLVESVARRSELDLDTRVAIARLVLKVVAMDEASAAVATKFPPSNLIQALEIVDQRCILSGTVGEANGYLIVLLESLRVGLAPDAARSVATLANAKRVTQLRLTSAKNSIRSLVDLLSSSDAETQERAARALSHLVWENIDLQLAVLLEHQALDALVRLLRSPSSLVQEQAASAIGSLIPPADYGITEVEASVPCLAMLLSSDKEPIRRQAARAIAALAGEQPVIQAAVAEVGGSIEAVVGLLASDDEIAQYHASRAIAKLVEGHSEIQNAVARVPESANALVRLLYSRRAVLKRHAAHALRNLISGQPRIKQMVVGCDGGVSALVQLLVSSNENVLVEAAAAIADLVADEPKIQERVASTRTCIDSLVKLLASNNKSLQRYAAQAIANLVEAQPSITEQVFEAEGSIAALVRLLMSSNEDVQAEAARAIANLVVDEPAIKVHFVETESSLEALAELLSSENAAVQENAARVFSSLTGGSFHLKDQIARTEGCINCLVRLSSSGSTAVQEHAASAITNLVRYEPEIQALVDRVRAMTGDARPETDETNSDDGNNAPRGLDRFARDSSIKRPDSSLARLRARSKLEQYRSRSSLESSPDDVGSLVRLLSSQSVSDQERGARAIAELTRSNPEKRDEVAAAKFSVPSLVRLMSSKELRVQSEAARAIASLVDGGGASIQQRVADTSGCVESLVQLLSSEDEGVQEHAASALASIVQDAPALQDQVVSAEGAVSLLLELSTSPNPKVEEQADRAVQNLMEGRPTIVKMVMAETKRRSRRFGKMECH